MASTSTVQKSFKYDVFLSFRGEDTRHNFVSHLYKALEQSGILTYKDDEKIEKGETIDTQLIKSIEDSRFFIIVFSKDYVGSSWCLDELVKIMECREASEQTAYPVFYDVEPTEIRKQSGVVGEAFQKHENKEAAGKWREALKESADLAGWERKKTANGDESKLIQIIVDDIFQNICSSSSTVDGNLVGMETRIEALLSSLELDAPGVRMIGIWGMGGGGKTTVATAIFHQICHQFEGSSFVDNVREVSKSSLSGLKELQKQILTDIFSGQSITVSSVSGGKNKMAQMMGRKKVLVVLDDVDCTDQLEALAGDSNWYKPGSRIIITTRDEQVLVAHRVGFINKVTLLSHTEAIRLFNRYAFTKETPIEGHKELSRQVVKYAHGLPLSIKVLGSLLCGQNQPQWKDALERLKKIPLKETMKILELSYDALDDDYKEIFLDVACLLKGWRINDAVIALKSCGFFAEGALRVLEQKSLITISDDYWQCLGMHDHIEEMGKNIVRRLNPNEPKRHSRLWNEEEIEEILANDLATPATQGMRVALSRSKLEILMKGLTNMKELRFLYIYDHTYVSSGDVSNWNLPKALRFLCWRYYPFSSFPKTFQPNNLVGLQMYNSNIRHLWKDGEEKPLLKLRFLKLVYTDLRTLDLSVAPNLETLILEGCRNLVEVHFQVTLNLMELCIDSCFSLEELHMPAECPKLTSLDLNRCLKLRTLHLGITPNLEKLRLKHCKDMVELRMLAEFPKLVNLDLRNLMLRTFHLGNIPNLETLSLHNCTDMVELYMLAQCSKLVYLDLCNLKLTTFHLGITPNLKSLRLNDCSYMVELHMPAECLKLDNLDLCNLKLRTLRLGITPNLKTVSLKDCTDMFELRMPAKCPKLIDVNLSNLKLTTLRFGIALNLETLKVNQCTEMVELKIPAECPKLVHLELCNLKLTTFHLGITPNLETLVLQNCADMIELPAKCLHLVKLKLSNTSLTTLRLGITNYETVNLEKCTDVAELHTAAQFPKLIFLELCNLKFTALDLGTTLNLETVILKDCRDLVELHLPFSCLKLRNLYLIDSNLRNLNLGMTPDLMTLILNECESLVELHMRFECPKLKVLSLCTTKLSTLDLELTPNLQSLDLKECHDLVKINAPFGCLKTLRYLDLTDCRRFESLLLVKRLPLVDVDSLMELYVTVESFDVWSLHGENNLPKQCLTSFHIQHPDGNLEKLISVCNLEISTVTICDFRCLRKLTLNGGFPEVPEFVVQLEGLEELILLSTTITHLPENICTLKYLKTLELKSCWLLEKLPESLGQLQCLEKLSLTESVFLRDIPNSICEMKCLKYFHLPYCLQVSELPEEIGRLECLKELDITGTGISQLPASILRVKGLRVVGSRWLLESCDFTSVIRTSGDETFCYI